MNNDFQKLVVILLLLIACVIFPFLLILVIPMGIYYYGKSQNNKSKLDDVIESQLLNKTPLEIENYRIYMFNLSQDPNATMDERVKAKLILDYLNKRKPKGM